MQLISDLHKSEVFLVGRELGVPSSVLDAAPSADLWEDQTDENELGCTYDFVELFHWYRTLTEAAAAEWKSGLSLDANKQFDSYAEMVVRTHRRNKHKESWPLNLNVASVDPKACALREE